MEKLQELFSLPIGVKVETKVEGFPLYSSDRIKERFVEAVLKSKFFSDLQEEIKKLVLEKQRVIPCWQTENVIKFIATKIFQSVLGFGVVAAFFEPVSKKIFIILDNYTNWFLVYPNSVLTRILRHELVHLCAESNPNLFMLAFKDYLVDYYVLFFKEIFKIPAKENITSVVWRIVKTMTEKFGLKTSPQTAMSLFPKVVSPLRDLSTDKKYFDKMVNDIVESIKIIALHGSAGFDILAKSYKHVLEPLYKTYDYLSIPTYGNACFQELTTPQEVIAIHVEKGILKEPFTRVLKSVV